MGFDQGSDQPLVDPAKRTTKVNLSMAIGIALFLIVGIFLIWYATHDHNRHIDELPTRSSTQ